MKCFDFAEMFNFVNETKKPLSPTVCIARKPKKKLDHIEMIRSLACHVRMSHFEIKKLLRLKTQHSN